MDLYSSIRGFSFNGRHNHDMGVVMHNKSIQPPSKKKIKETVPFMNGSYDFSRVGTNGEITYTNREITVTIGLPTDSKEKLQVLYSKTLQWLMDAGKSKLIFDDSIDYYYMAEIENASSFEEVMNFGLLSITFVADPFKHSTQFVGEDIWDVFNFEEDYNQDVEFEVSEVYTANIYNPGRIISPIVDCTAHMKIKLSGRTYEFISGENKNWEFKLQPGLNVLTITGTGTIKIVFRKGQI